MLLNIEIHKRKRKKKNDQISCTELRNFFEGFSSICHDDTYSVSIGIAHTAEKKPASVVPAVLIRSYNFSASTESFQ